MMTLRIERKLDAKRRQRGFTLIELLVVIAIISILASIVYASVGSQRAKGRDAKRIAEMQAVATALEAYFDQNIVDGANTYLPETNTSCGTFSEQCFEDIVATLYGQNLLPTGTMNDPLNNATHAYGGQVTGTQYTFSANLERDNVACTSDLDAGTGIPANCDDNTAGNCSDSVTDSDSGLVADYCVGGLQ